MPFPRIALQKALQKVAPHVFVCSAVNGRATPWHDGVIEALRCAVVSDPLAMPAAVMSVSQRIHVPSSPALALMLPL